MSVTEAILGYIIARLMAKRCVKDCGHSSPCWIWTGSLMNRGYGQIGVFYKNYRVHRLAYDLLVGPIPEAMTLDHLCRVKACFNPDHLEAVTAGENSRRAFTSGVHGAAYLAARSHCGKGHEFTPQNTAHYSGSRGRICRECYRAKNRQRYARTRAA